MFENPEYALAAVLALVPVLVHGTPYLRVRERSFPALHFLLRRYPTRFQRFRMLNRFLVGLRTLMVGALVALFAMPATEVRLPVPQAPVESFGTVLVVSTSVEMSEVTPGGTLRDLAVAQAAAWIAREAPERILVADTCRGLPAGDLWGTREEALERLRDLPQAWQTCAAGPVVREALARWPRPGFRVVLVTAPRSEAGAPAAPALEDRRVTRVMVEAPRRASGTILGAERRREGIRAVVSLQGDHETHLSLFCPSREAPEATVPLRGSGLRSVTLPVASPCQAGWWEVSLDPDGLVVDDRVRVDEPHPPELSVLLVDGGFGGRLEERRTRFLEPALRALDGADFRVRLRVLDQEEFTGARLEGTDLVVLADPHGLRPHLRRSLTRWMDAGGTLLVTAGPRLARWEDGQGLVPGRWRLADLPPQLEPGLEAADASSTLASVLATVQERGRRIVLQQRLVVSRVTEAEAETLVRFSDGAPALVRWRAGGGGGFLLTASADLSFGELPLHAAFPVLLGAIAQEVAAGRTTRRDALRCTAGAPCDVLSRIPAGWDLVDPAGASSPELPARLAAGDPTLEPGPFLLQRGEERRLLVLLELSPETRRALASPCPAAAAAGVSRAAGPTLREDLEDRAPVRFWIILAVLACLLVEGWVALRQ
ncbi:MAG: BatA domain-containing protein [Deltaproteobacteria bacterium]|nr:BatA domain-containing protein [Deltaproteobacteria bacterium]